MGLIEVPNAPAQPTGRKRHVSLCSTGSCSTRSNYCQPYPGRRVRARSGWRRVSRRWRLPRRRRPSGRRSRWGHSCGSRGCGSDTVTGEGIIHVVDTARRRWGPQRLVPRPRVPTAPMAITTTATTRTAIISVASSIDIDTRRAHADGGWASPYRRPFLLNLRRDSISSRVDLLKAVRFRSLGSPHAWQRALPTRTSRLTPPANYRRSRRSC